MKNFKINKFCNEKWAIDISFYWKFLTGKMCYVFLADTNDSIVLLNYFEDNKKSTQALLFEKPIFYPFFRNFLWHEAGHIFGDKSDNIIEKEFLADKWAIHECIDRKFNRIAEEIIFRCVHNCNSENQIQKQSSKMILNYFRDFASKIKK